jgi:lysophospholipase L1-like esterase
MPEFPPSEAIGRRSLILKGCALSLCIVLAIEGALRLGGRPRGLYVAGLLEGISHAGGPWEPGYDAVIESGPIPYRLVANTQGFRGPELRSDMDSAALRVVAIGDSFTEGFYVDNAFTYPFQLEQVLQAQGLDAEVINTARGGGSIDRFRQLLERCVLPLQPDVVLVSFVNNDLSDLGWFPLESAAQPASNRAASLFVGRTAIGECLLEAILGTPALELSIGLGGDELVADPRYQIENGEQYTANAGVFMQRYGASDGLALGTELGPLAQRAFEIYRAQLEQFVKSCEAQAIRVMLFYVPAYPEIYVQRPSSAGRRLLAAEAEKLGIGFVDLTDALRQASLDQGLGPLHLAPLDFHLNPKGNRVVAQRIALALGQQGWLPAVEDH